MFPHFCPRVSELFRAPSRRMLPDCRPKVTGCRQRERERTVPPLPEQLRSKQGAPDLWISRLSEELHEGTEGQ